MISPHKSRLESRLLFHPVLFLKASLQKSMTNWCKFQWQTRFLCNFHFKLFLCFLFFQTFRSLLFSLYFLLFSCSGASSSPTWPHNLNFVRFLIIIMQFVRSSGAQLVIARCVIGAGFVLVPHVFLSIINYFLVIFKRSTVLSCRWRHLCTFQIPYNRRCSSWKFYELSSYM